MNSCMRCRASYSYRASFFIFLPILILLTSTSTVRAQQFVRTSDRLPPPSPTQASGQEEEEYIKPARPGVANPAEPHQAGVLQLEYGYDGIFRGEDFDKQQTAPLALRFAASDRVLFEFNLDTVKSETDLTGTRMTGIGDVRLGFQLTALKDTSQHPALAFGYLVKLPTASQQKGLGTGRVDHKIILLLSKKLGEVDMDINGAYLIVGREDEPGWVTGGQGAISFSGQFKNGFGLQGELSGQSKDDILPPGVYALGALTYRVNRRLILDGGMRFGLNPDAPRYGVFAGLTVGVANLYKK
jgi:hypothetical protein